MLESTTKDRLEVFVTSQTVSKNRDRRRRKKNRRCVERFFYIDSESPRGMKTFSFLKWKDSYLRRQVDLLVIDITARKCFWCFHRIHETVNWIYTCKDHADRDRSDENPGRRRLVLNEFQCWIRSLKWNLGGTRLILQQIITAAKFIWSLTGEHLNGAILQARMGRRKFWIRKSTVFLLQLRKSNSFPIKKSFGTFDLPSEHQIDRLDSLGQDHFRIHVDVAIQSMSHDFLTRQRPRYFQFCETSKKLKSQMTRLIPSFHLTSSQSLSLNFEDRILNLNLTAAFGQKKAKVTFVKQRAGCFSTAVFHCGFPLRFS